MRLIKKARLKKVIIFEAFFLSFFLCFSLAFAATPAVGTITPSSGSTVPDTAKTFTCKYSDADGWANIKEAYLLISSGPTVLSNSVYLYYDSGNNLLYLRDDANTIWLGGYAPGSANAVENSQVTLNCGASSVSGAKRALTVNFNITFKTAYSGKTYNSYLKVVDAGGGYAGWTIKGSYSINSTPQAGTVIPQSGTSSPNQQINFETTYSDPDGWQNIQYVYFLINTSTGGAKCFYGYYDQNTNKIYLRNDTNKAWLGGYAPGSNNIIENSYAKINCLTSSFSGSGNDLTVNWLITFKISFTGTKNTYLYVKDDLNAYVNWTKIGSWSIAVDTTPPTGAITINDNASYTNSVSVTLNLSAQDNIGGSGVDKMQFSSDDVVWVSPEPYAASKSWTLNTGEGTKVVYVKYGDAAGNWSTVYSDTIILDAVAPAVPVVNAVTSPTNISTQTLSGTKESNTSIWINGQEVVTLNNETTWSSVVTLVEGVNNVSITAKDAVGNDSSAALVAIVLDTTLPNPPQGITITVDAAKADLSWTANSETDLAGYNIYRSTISGSGYEKLNSSFINLLIYQDSGLISGATYYYVITAQDNAGNESIYSSEVSSTLSEFSVEIEPNDDISSANILQLDTAVKGYIDPAADQDYFKINIPKTGKMTVSLTDVPANITAMAYIYDSNQSLVAYSNNVGPGSNIVLEAGPFSAGDYYIRIFDAVGVTNTLSQYSLKISYTDLWFTSYSSYPFSPNNDGVQDSTVISANVNAPANWTINIKDSSGVVKQIFTGIGTDISQVWNGWDTSGALVTDGVYSYTIDAVNLDTGLAARQAQGQVIVDNILPNASIIEPESDAEVSGIVTIKGIADDKNYYYATLYYGQGTAPESWNYIAYLAVQTGVAPATLADFNTINLFNGDYVLRLEAFDSAGNRNRQDIPVKLYNVTIYNVACSPTIISPNSDGEQDSTVIRANVTASVKWTINIKDSSSVVKWTFTGIGANISQVWNGVDSFGAVVPDGVYSYTIDAVDLNTGSTATQMQGQVIVDNTLPTANITELESGAEVSGIVTIKGIADDKNYYYATLCYGQGTSPVNWTYIVSYIEQTGLTPGILADFDTTNLPNGDYVLSLEVFDSASNRNRHDLPVKFNNIAIYSVVVSPNPFSPNGDGNFDAARFSASLTKILEWTIEIRDINNTIVKTYTGTGNIIYQSWNGQDSNSQTVADGVYKYTIKASDIATGTNAVAFNGEVVVDNTKPTAIISEPKNNQEISGVFDIKGVVKDSNYNANNRCFLSYGRGMNPTAWEILCWLNGPVEEDVNNIPSLIYQWGTGNLSNGVYTLHLFAADAAGNTSEVKNTVNLYNVGVLSHAVSPACFSPNNDGKSDIAVINASLTMPAQWTIKINDKGNNQVRVFTGASDTIVQEWDGKDSFFNIVPDGVYSYTVDIFDPEINKAGVPASGIVTVDNTPPVAFISSPAVNEVITNTFEIKGIAKDLNYDGRNNQCFLAYAKESSPENWSVLAYLYNPILEDYTGNPCFIYTLNFAAFPGGKYRLKLFVTDAAQNSTEFVQPFIVCKVNNYYAEPVLFSPNGDGRYDTTTFIAAFSRPVDWTINIKNPSGAIVRNFSGTGLNIYQIWDGKNDALSSVVSDGVYTFDISASVQGTGEAILNSSGNVEVDNTAPTVNIIQPAANSNITWIVPVSVISNDPHYDNSKSALYYGQGALPSEWKLIYTPVLPSPVEYTATNWNTSFLKNGAYTLRLAVYDLAGNYAQAETPVNVYNVGILSFSDGPDPFTPDNDGAKETNTITAALTTALNWNIVITDRAHNLIRNFNSSGETISCVWDGKNNSGQLAVEGVFNYRIEATDNTKNAAPANGTITMDTSLPIAVITAPSDNSVVAGFVTITGTASDNNIYEYKVEYGYGATPEAWELIYKNYNSITNGILADWDCAKVINGVYTLKLTVTDIAGHTASAQVKVTVDHINITNISVTPKLINPQNNETSSINYAIDRAADITIKIYDLDNNLKRNLITAVWQPASSNSEIWDGKDDAGNIVDNNVYTITIEAQSGAARGWYQSKDRLETNTVTALNFSVSPAFNPYSNELCKITYTLPQSVFFLLIVGQSENFDTLNTLVNWELRLAGPHTEYWNGRDGHGEILDYYTEHYPIIIGYRTLLLPENSIVVSCAQPEPSEILTDLSASPYIFLPVLGEFTYIKYTISLPGVVSVSICKASGEVIKNLENNASKAAGTYNLRWDGIDQTGKIIGENYSYIIKVDFTGADGKIISRSINITTR